MSERSVALLDTSVIIDPPEDYTSYAEMLCVSAVSIGELAFGLHTSDPLTTARREQVYRETLEDYDPIPYDAAIAHGYGAIAAAVRGTGRNPRPRMGDLMIAATAHHLGASILTRNPKDFKGLEGIIEVAGL